MTLSDLLDDLVADEPPLGVDARAAWATGRARRQRRVPRLLAAVAAVLGLLALVAPAVPVPSATATRPVAVDVHPARLEQPWSVDPLPDRPGAVAALVHWPERTWRARLSWLLPDERQESGTDPNLLHLVSATGEVWLGPSGLMGVTLSPDGRLLGGLRDRDGAYVVRDLVAGGSVVVEGVAARSAAVAGAAQLPDDSPARWSPDGRHLAVYAGHALVLDVVAGSFRRVPPPGPGVFVGWRSSSELVFLDRQAQEAVTTDLSGEVRARVRLLDLPPRDVPFTQTTVTVSADGSALVLPDGFGLRWHDLATGRPLQQVDYPQGGGGVCGLGPFGVAGSQDLVVTELPATERDEATALRFGPEAAADVQAQISPMACPVWAAQALAGPASEGPALLGLRARAALGAGALVALLAVLLRRRT